MLKYAIAYLAAGAAFAVVDAVWLTTVGPRLYRPALDEVLAESFRLPAAIAFYLIYIAGVLLLAILPAAREGRGLDAGADERRLAGLHGLRHLRPDQPGHAEGVVHHHHPGRYRLGNLPHRHRRHGRVHGLPLGLGAVRLIRSMYGFAWRCRARRRLSWWVYEAETDPAAGHISLR